MIKKENLRIIVFSLASMCSFCIDYVLFSGLIILTNNVTISNISARVVSGIANYLMNKKIVFKNSDKIYKTAIQYFLLALTILALNTVLLNILVNILGWNAYISKVIVEIALFILSWLVQKKKIFKKNKN